MACKFCKTVRSAIMRGYHKARRSTSRRRPVRGRRRSTRRTSSTRRLSRSPGKVGYRL